MASALPTAKGSSVGEQHQGNACPPEHEPSKHVQDLAGRVKGMGNKLFKTSRKTKLNGRMLPRGSLFATALATVMTAMACLDATDATRGATGMANRCTMNQINPLCMEFLLDSGADRSLISKKHLPEETHEMFSKAPGGTRFQAPR